MELINLGAEYEQVGVWLLSHYVGGGRSRCVWAEHVCCGWVGGGSVSWGREDRGLEGVAVYEQEGGVW
jgi:hypothetical protein